MYSIKCNIKDKTKIGNIPVDEDGNFIIYDDIYPTNGAKALSPKLSLKDNGPGQLDFKLPPGNVGYDLLERMSSEIIICRNGSEIWSGRIISETNDFQNNRTLVCEGALAYLNDTTQEQRIYENYTISDFLVEILEEHRSKVVDEKNKIWFGGCDFSGSETYSFKTKDNATLSVISEQLINRFGGHVIIKREIIQEAGPQPVNCLYYHQNYYNEHSQTINFGHNLLDFTRNWEVVEFSNVVTPRYNNGEDEETGLDDCIYATVANNGSRYITNESSISEIGWIESVIDLDETGLDDLLQLDNTFKKLCNNAGDIELSIAAHIPNYGNYRLFVPDGLDWNLEPNYDVIISGSSITRLDRIKKALRDYIGNNSIPENSKIMPRLFLGLIILIIFIYEEGTTEAITEVDEDVIPVLLKIAGENYLSDQQFNNIIIDINAVDLNYLGITSDYIGLLDTIRCISAPHNFNKSLPVTELTMQLDKPDSSTYTLSGTFNNGDFEVAASSISAPTASGSISEQYSDIIKNEKKAFRDATRLINSATRGHVTIQRSIKGTESIAIAENLSYDPKTDLWDEGTKLWKWNLGGLGYSTDGGRNYSGAAITMDGTINANFLKVGTISDQQNNVVWNLNSGELIINKGHIQMGYRQATQTYRFEVTNSGVITAREGNIGGFTIDDNSIYNDVISLENDGIWIKKGSDNFIGKIGSNSWKNHPSRKGLVMDLNNNGSYICWAYEESSSSDEFTVKLLYAAEDFLMFDEDTINCLCTFDLQNNYMKYCKIDSSTVAAVNENGRCVTDGYVYLPTLIEEGKVTLAKKVLIQSGFILPP